MLRQLAIRDVVLVDQLELEFEPGLGVLTGETGAGKSILLDALGLALGARADTGLVRQRRGRSVGVAPSSSLPAEPSGSRAARRAGHRARAGRAADPAADAEGRRRQPRLRRRRGGAAAGLLRDIAALGWSKSTASMTIAGCSTRGATARLLDAFGGIDVGAGRGAWARSRGSKRSWPRRAPSRGDAERDRDWLEHASSEIEALAPEPGEETRLAEERAAMQAGAKAGEALSGLDELLGGSDGALGPAAAGGAADRARRRRPSACSPKRWRRSTGR